MTTDEMIDNYQKRVGDGFTRFGVRELMKAYARSKCAEQRKICSNVGGISFDAHCRIQDAPEPEME